MTGKEHQLTNKQQEILEYLFRFRYLNAVQIQQLLEHKEHERIRSWLSDLTTKHYTYRHYTRTIPNTPAYYCLDKNSIPYLRKKQIPEKLLKRIYTEKIRSKQFQIHTGIIATIYLSLQILCKRNNATLHFYSKTQLETETLLPLPHPDCYFAIEEPSQDIFRYFLDLFDDKTFLYKRVYQYLSYYKKQYWNKKMNVPFPKILFICPDKTSQNRIHNFIRKKRSGELPEFYLSSLQTIHELGLCKQALQKVM